MTLDIGRLLDFLLPPLCINCRTEVDAHQTLCPNCWKTIRFIASPFCSRCGLPFEAPVEEGALCGECIAGAFVFNRARSAMVYNDASKQLVLGLKHGDKLHLVPAIASMMYRAGAELLETADIIVPVPLHRWRLFMRRFNQAALLVKELARISGRTACFDALLRVRPTPSQGKLNRDQRKKNISEAFRINPKCTGKVSNKNVLLVDDVFTTGITVNECSRVLLKAGAAKVDILTLMRTCSFSHIL